MEVLQPHTVKWLQELDRFQRYYYLGDGIYAQKEKTPWEKLKAFLISLIRRTLFMKVFGKCGKPNVALSLQNHTVNGVEKAVVVVVNAATGDPVDIGNTNGKKDGWLLSIGPNGVNRCGINPDWAEHLGIALSTGNSRYIRNVGCPGE